MFVHLAGNFQYSDAGLLTTHVAARWLLRVIFCHNPYQLLRILKVRAAWLRALLITRADTASRVRSTAHERDVLERDFLSGVLRR